MSTLTWGDSATLSIITFANLLYWMRYKSVLLHATQQSGHAWPERPTVLVTRDIFLFAKYALCKNAFRNRGRGLSRERYCPET